MKTYFFAFDPLHRKHDIEKSPFSLIYVNQRCTPIHARTLILQNLMPEKEMSQIYCQISHLS